MSALLTLPSQFCYPYMQDLASSLLSWYHSYRRDLHWRLHPSPYRIWLSEIILQQTRVAQGTPYYMKFIEHYPTVTDLANADEEEVLKLWQGLGYYSRARNLLAAARQIRDDFNGSFPDNYQDLLTLKGVGPYTAAAIASIAFNEKVPVVDGNVMRVMARLFEIHDPMNEKHGLSQVQQGMESLIPADNPGDFNQAVMELGAMICSPTNPACLHCPVNTSCLGRENGTHLELPKKSKKQKTKEVFIQYYVVQSGDEILLRKRITQGIWKNLFDFPDNESNSPFDTDAPNNFMSSTYPDVQVQSIEAGPHFTHILSHRKMQVQFVRIYTANLPTQLSDDLRRINVSELQDFPVSRLVEKFLHTTPF